MDSCKVRIPIDRVHVLNDSLLSHWIPAEVNKETGEIRETGFDFKSKAYYHNQTGISTRMAIEKQMTAEKRTKEFLTIGINSKMLRSQERYFQGITTGNIPPVHEYLLSLKLAAFSLDDFKAAQVTDVDYKKDFYCDDIDALTLKLELLTIPKKKKGQGCKRYRESSNKGIEWSDRKSTAITTAPFLKVYSKDLDLKYNSSEFSRIFINTDISNIARVEVTIKNRKHFKLYGVTDTRLINTTNLPQETMESMIQRSIRKHIERPVRPRTESGEIPPREQEMINIIALLQAGRIGLNEARLNLFAHLHPKTMKRRQEFFDEVWQKHFSKLPSTTELNHVEKWLNEVGVQFL